MHRVMNHLLEQLFESSAKVRILRIFMQNPDSIFTFPEVTKRSQLRARHVRAELNKLLRIGVIKTRIAAIKYEIKKRSRAKKKPLPPKIKSKKMRVFYTDKKFELWKELNDLVTKSSVASRKKLFQQIKELGSVKLAVMSGIFLNNDRARTDLLVVGDGIKRKKMESFLAKIESEIGTSLRYTLMDTREFQYRLNMYDRFLRDILEYPHEKLINKLHISR